MTRRARVVVALVIAGTPGCAAAQSPSRDSALRSLAAAERAFAAMARATNIPQSFRANLRAGAIVFRPGPVKYGTVSRNAQPGPDQLQWEPTYVDVAESGELGLSTGPSQYRANGPADTVVRYGQFVSVWRKENGVWKVDLDIGTATPRPSAAPSLATRVRGDRWWPDARTARVALLHVDSSTGVGARSERDALTPLFTYETRLHRVGLPPVSGAALAIPHLDTATPYESQPLGGETAASGDFGYTYGEFAEGPAAARTEGYYVRFWRRRADGAWYIVLDLAVPRSR